MKARLVMVLQIVVVVLVVLLGCAPSQPVVTVQLPIAARSMTISPDGKKVALGHKGSGAEQVGLMQLAAVGITPETIEAAGGVVSNMSYAAMGDGLGDKSLDACFFNTALCGVHPSFKMVEERFGIRLLEMPDDAKKALVEKDPLLGLYEVPGGLYKGNPEPVTSPGDPWGIVTRAELADDFIYQFLELIYSDEVAKTTVEKWVMYTGFGDPEFGLLGADTIPMHPGAAKFFKEKYGIDVAAKGIEVK